MYKIYINDCLFMFCDFFEMVQVGIFVDGYLVVCYFGKFKFILNYVDLLEKGLFQVESVMLFYMDVEEFWIYFKEYYFCLEVVGGFVYNFVW